MATPDTIIPASPDWGIPSFNSESWGGTPPLLTGPKEVRTGVEKVAASTTLAAYTVVGRDGSGNLTKAVLGTTVPCGILAVGVTTASGVTTTVEVMKSGTFNPDALVWDASYNTDDKKLKAFESSLAPEVSILKPRYSPQV